MRSYTEVESSSLREAFRRPDGKFGSVARTETLIDLDLPVDPFNHAWEDYETQQAEEASRPAVNPVADLDIDRLVEQWGERLGLPGPREGDDDAGLNHRIDEVRQSQTLDQILPTPVEVTPAAAATRSWQRRILDMVMPRMAPPGYFTLRQTMKTSLTKGGLLMSGIALFAVTSHAVGVYVRAEPGHDTPSRPVDSNALRLNELSVRYDCYSSGLGEGEIPAHAIIRVVNSDGSTLKVVSFDRGWAAHMDKMDNKVLQAVCRD